MKENTYIVFSNIGPWTSDYVGFIGTFAAPASSIEQALKDFAEGHLESLGAERSSGQADSTVSFASCDLSGLRELYDKTGMNPCYARENEACWCKADSNTWRYDHIIFVAVSINPKVRETLTEQISNKLFALETNLDTVERRIERGRTDDLPEVFTDMRASIEKIKDLVKIDE